MKKYLLIKYLCIAMISVMNILYGAILFFVGINEKTVFLFVTGVILYIYSLLEMIIKIDTLVKEEQRMRYLCKHPRFVGARYKKNYKKENKD